VATSHEFIKKTRASKRNHGLQADRLRALLQVPSQHFTSLELVDANFDDHATRTPRSSTSIKLGSVPDCRMACLTAMGRQRAALREVTNDPHLLKDIA
jgi:hypothetical protein